MDRQIIETYFPIVASILLATLFCLKFSFTTSPFFHINGQDSAIFYIFGKYWAEGAVPYVDLWDHKGPIIFFINCLGYLITKSKIGILLLQICSLSVFNFFTYKTFRLTFSALASFALNVFSLFWLACSYEGGNLTEEYLLPYLAAAIFFVMQWIRKRESSGPVDINPWVAFLLGGILAFSFLTRLTNALGACGMMLGIGIVLLFDKRWKNLVKCVLFYIAGFVAICLPFFIYFGAYHALDEMMFGTLFYNVQNIKATTEVNNSLSFLINKEHILFLLSGMICYILLGISFIDFFVKIKQKVLSESSIWLFATLLYGLWFFRSALFYHYLMLCVPFVPVIVSLLYHHSYGSNSILCFIYKIAILTIVIFPFLFLGVKYTSMVRNIDRTDFVNHISKEIYRIVPETEINDLVTYELPPSIYISLNIKPLYHNFSFPETQGQKSEKLKRDIIQEYSSCKAKWVVTPDIDTLLISSVLEKKYILEQRSPGYEGVCVWKRVW